MRLSAVLDVEPRDFLERPAPKGGPQAPIAAPSRPTIIRFRSWPELHQPEFQVLRSVATETLVSSDPSYVEDRRESVRAYLLPSVLCRLVVETLNDAPLAADPVIRIIYQLGLLQGGLPYAIAAISNCVRMTAFDRDAVSIPDLLGGST